MVVVVVVVVVADVPLVLVAPRQCRGRILPPLIFQNTLWLVMLLKREEIFLNGAADGIPIIEL